VYRREKSDVTTDDQSECWTGDGAEGDW